MGVWSELKIKLYRFIDRSPVRYDLETSLKYFHKICLHICKWWMYISIHNHVKVFFLSKLLFRYKASYNSDMENSHTSMQIAKVYEIRTETVTTIAWASWFSSIPSLPFEADARLNNIYESSSYLKENTKLHHCKDQLRSCRLRK